MQSAGSIVGTLHRVLGLSSEARRSQLLQLSLLSSTPELAGRGAASASAAQGEGSGPGHWQGECGQRRRWRRAGAGVGGGGALSGGDREGRGENCRLEVGGAPGGGGDGCQSFHRVFAASPRGVVDGSS